MIAMLVIALGATAGCADKRRKLGDLCGSGDQCESDMCLGGRCLDPDGDQDGDTLTNNIEFELGSDPFNADTDNDQVSDPDELEAISNVDTDGDGKADIVESIVFDSDNDCLPDQLDPDDGAITSDLSAMIARVCKTAGVCAGGGLAVTCDSNAIARCVYAGVAGYADPEVACDRRDENCDGTVDEGFAPGCVVARNVPPAIVAGGASRRTSRYQARITIGPPPGGAVTTLPAR